jgi:biopolymer transport protein ExbD
MHFRHRKRKQPPAIIIISLIDILIVLLIFLMVTTSFKQTPSVRLALPESKQPKEGASDSSVIVTIAKTAPHFYLETRPVTTEKLQQELAARVAKNPQLTLAIRADQDTPVKDLITVMDIARAVKVKGLTMFTKSPGQR